MNTEEKLYKCSNNNTFSPMPTKRIFVPDDIIRPTQPGEDKHVRLLQYTNTTTQENFDAFLTHHALVYILSGMKQIQVSQARFQIQPGELFLIPKGEYVMSEYITDENGFQSFMLFFSKRIAQDLIEQLGNHLPNDLSATAPAKKEAIKIIPHNRNIKQLFTALETYSQSKSAFTCELIRLKFTELIYLLLDSPYQKVIGTFLLDAARSESPSISSVLDNYLYSSTTIHELSLLSGRSLSSFKREFARQYGEAPQGWIRKKKLERAAYLLETSAKTIEEVAETSGFVSHSHFARLFKEQYGATPSECRLNRMKNTLQNPV